MHAIFGLGKLTLHPPPSGHFYPVPAGSGVRNFAESFGTCTSSSPVSLHTATRVPFGERVPEGDRRFVTVMLALRTRCIVVSAQQARCEGAGRVSIYLPVLA
jgi:hypothetical protein